MSYYVLSMVHDAGSYKYSMIGLGWWGDFGPCLYRNSSSSGSSACVCCVCYCGFWFRFRANVVAWWVVICGMMNALLCKTMATRSVAENVANCVPV
jgi:hypothetical protein